MHIAVIGSGISGLTAAWLLSREHHVTIFEANDYVGGHTHTVTVDLQGKPIPVDTGFIVFNDWTYPNFIALLKTLDVDSVPTSMGFSVTCDRTGLEYCGSSFGSLFAQKRNLIRPRFYRLILDILRFNREAPDSLLEATEETVGEFLNRRGYSHEFAKHYLLPMGAAIWSCPMQTFEQFPIRFIVEFYLNHGLLLISGRPTWRTIPGGAKRYVEKFLTQLGDRILLNAPVQSVHRSADNVTLKTAERTEIFDEVVFACHSDQALKILADPDQTERDVLTKFPYSQNTAILHTDESVLPKRRNAWASWNYRVGLDPAARPSVTYNMNILQHLETAETVCVTLNNADRIDPDQILGTYQYSHPVFTIERDRAQRRHAELIRHQRTSYCGAYWGNGFHDDGVNSALAVSRQFGILPPWQTSEEPTLSSVSAEGMIGEGT